MVTLKNILTDSSKARRHRSNLLNIQITMLAWLTEFMGFFAFLLGSFLVGQRNKPILFLLQLLSASLNFIILPSIFLISNSQLKSNILDSNWYLAFIHRFSPQPSQELGRLFIQHETNNVEIERHHEDNASVEELNNDENKVNTEESDNRVWPYTQPCTDETEERVNKKNT